MIQAEEYLEHIPMWTREKHSLTEVRGFLDQLGNPDRETPAIHVAGTNGKGSTTNDIRSVLQEAGYTVGSFTSPYMITHYDRIRINDVYIDEQEFLDISNAHYEEWMKWDLSMFEIDTCIAILYFLKHQVDYCVFEVGMGGRLDSTNILRPMVSIITNIGLDHMEFLGDTKEKIANEKAGIIKSGIDLITGEHDAGCLAVFQKHVTDAGSEMFITGDITNLKEYPDGIVFDYGSYAQVHLQSHAAYQSKNAALCIEVIDYLNRKQRISVNEAQLRSGLKKANWIGRFEIIQEKPLLLLDGAHNAHGIKALVEVCRGMKTFV